VSRSADKDPLVYKLTNMVNGRGYVGKATNSQSRMYQHRSGKTYGGRKKEYRAANKRKRVLLGRTADTSGWSAQGKGARK